MESRPKKRQIEWRFSPIRKDKSLKLDKNVLENVNTQTAKLDKTLWDFWRSPKFARTAPEVGTSSIRASSAPNSPCKLVSSKKTSPVKNGHTINKVADIEDLMIGSSFFSDEPDLVTPVSVPAPFDQRSSALDFPRKLLIQRVERGSMVINGLTRPQIALYCQYEDINQSSSTIVTILLGDLWIDCDYRPGSWVYVSPDPGEETILVNRDSGLLLTFDPDTLISITTIADAVSCLRKATLTMQMQPVNSDNVPTIHLATGSIVHEVFERVLQKDNMFDKEDTFDLSSTIDAMIKANVLAVYACGVEEEDVQKHAIEILKTFPAWFRQFRREAPHSSAQVTDELCTNLPKISRSVCIPTVYSLEESVKSRILGMKGKIDSVVMLRFTMEDGQMASLVVPLELKTGKSTSSTAHRAQTLLYTLLLAERYKIPIHFGLLFYVSSGTLLRIAVTSEELQALMMIRNRIASTSTSLEKNHIPPTISNGNLCKQCKQLSNCISMIKINGESDKLNDFLSEKLSSTLVDNNVKDNQQKDFTFWRKWNQLISLEEAKVRELAEKHRHQFIKGSLVSIISDSSEYGNNIGKHLVELEIIDKANCDLDVNDPISISIDGDYEIAIGFVKALSLGKIVISCDNNIKETRKAIYSSKVQQDLIINDGVDTIFRIRKDGMTTGFALNRSNITQLYSTPNERLYRQLVRMDPPVFDVVKEEPSFFMTSVFDQVPVVGGNSDSVGQIMSPSLEMNSLSKLTKEKEITNPKYQISTENSYVSLDFETEGSQLDPGQKEAIRHCLSAKDYSLLLGMPGTGKTTTLVTLIQELVSRGKKILISSYTHSAVDNILVRLLDRGMNVLRLGNIERVEKRLLKHTLTPFNHPTVSDVRKAIDEIRIVGVTCLGINNVVLGPNNRFDYCIIDEASQITVPSVIGPLLLADKFILVGDHYQLPPLVQSNEAAMLGLGRSLFQTLVETHPKAVATLASQYRMCEDVQYLANKTVYNGMLYSHSKKVLEARLDVNLAGLFCNICGDSSTCWIRDILNPDRRVLFVNTDNLGSYLETASGSSFQNLIEANLISTLICAMINSGVKSEQICVIAAFRPQIRLLVELLPKGVEVSTVDKYQGRDRDCVILSFVKSNPDNNIGSLLKDWHRLNVAFTRARKKLIMFGSWNTIMSHQILSPLRNILIDRQWICELSDQASLHEPL